MRTAIKKTDVYSFAELEADAKEKAIAWYREGNLDHEWWDFIFEDAKELGKLMGIEIDNIYFSGFSSQGDGACFEGSYEYAKGSVKAVKAYAPMDKELHQIALDLSKAQRPYFYELSATVKHSGHYSHAYCTEIHVYDNSECQHYDYSKSFTDAEESIAEYLRDFMHWIYKRLENEYDYQNSDEVCEESIILNEYEFDEDGNIY